MSQKVFSLQNKTSYNPFTITITMKFVSRQNQFKKKKSDRIMVTVMKEYKRKQNTLVYLFSGEEPTFRIQNEFSPPSSWFICPYYFHLITLESQSSFPMNQIDLSQFFYCHLLMISKCVTLEQIKINNWKLTINKQKKRTSLNTRIHDAVTLLLIIW